MFQLRKESYLIW